MTPMENRIYVALTSEPSFPGQIADRAGLRNYASPRETAATFCRRLVKKGLAVRTGPAMHPRWHRAPVVDGD